MLSASCFWKPSPQPTRPITEDSAQRGPVGGPRAIETSVLQGDALPKPQFSLHRGKLKVKADRASRHCLVLAVIASQAPRALGTEEEGVPTPWHCWPLGCVGSPLVSLSLAYVKGLEETVGHSWDGAHAARGAHAAGRRGAGARRGVCPRMRSCPVSAGSPTVPVSVNWRMRMARGSRSSANTIVGGGTCFIDP